MSYNIFQKVTNNIFLDLDFLVEQNGSELSTKIFLKCVKFTLSILKYNLNKYGLITYII